MMVAGRGDLTLAAFLNTEWMRAPGWAPAHTARGRFAGRALAGRGVHALKAEAGSHNTGQGCLRVIRQLAKCSHGRRERSCVPERASVGRTLFV